MSISHFFLLSVTPCIDEERVDSLCEAVARDAAINGMAPSAWYAKGYRRLQKKARLMIYGHAYWPTKENTEYGSNPGREMMQKNRFLRYGSNIGQKPAKTTQITICRQCVCFGNMLGLVLKKIYPHTVGKYWQIQKTSFVCHKFSENGLTMH